MANELDCSACGEKSVGPICKRCADKLRTDMKKGFYIGQWTRRSGNYPQKDLFYVENGLLFVHGDNLPMDKSWMKNIKGPFTIEQIEQIEEKVK